MSVPGSHHDSSSRGGASVIESERVRLSGFQQSLWTLDQLNGGDPSLHMAAVLLTDRSLDPVRFRRAFDAVVAQHAVLRAHLEFDEGTPHLVAVDDLRVEVTEDGDSGSSLERDESGAPAAFVEREKARFDLTAGPLMRCHLIAHSDGYAIGITLHHLIADGVSMQVLMRELADAYRDPEAERPAVPLPVPAPERADDVDWWAAQCEGATPDLHLPLEPARESGPRRGRASRLRLTPDEGRQIQGLARRVGGSVFAVHLAALALLAARTSGAERPVIGVPFSGRSEETQDRIGCFVRTMPVAPPRADGELSERFVESTGAHLWEALEHEHAAYDAIARTLRQRGQTVPQIRVLLNMVPFSTEGLTLGETTVEVVELDTLSPKFDATIYVRDVAGERGMFRQLDLVHDADRWTPEAAEIFLEQYRHVLAALIAHPDAPADGIALPAAPVPQAAGPLPARGESLLEAVRDTCRRVPDRLAIQQPGSEVTYGQLWSMVRAGAARLTAHGVGAGDRVALHGDRGAGLVAGMLAAWAVGAGFVVIHAEDPADRILRLVAATRPAAFLVTDLTRVLPSEVSAALSEQGIPVLRPSGAPADADADDLPVVAEPEIAYVQLTSGSSGRPEAVAVGPAALRGFLPWYIEQFELSEDDRFAWFSTPGHDPSLRDVFAPLVLGASLAVPPDQHTRLHGELAEWAIGSAITVANLIPSLVEVLRVELAGRTLDSLRRVFFGGQALTAGHVRGAREFAPNAELVNGYGATETPQLVLWHPLASGDAANPPLGRTRPDVSVFVRAANGKPAAVGEPGELLISTPILAAGYLDGGDEASARFDTDPDGIPRYATGDIVRVRADGLLAFVGRRDRQVKVNGNRVEPNEVEAVLAACPGVAEAAVCLPSQPAGAALAALIVRSPGGDVATPELLAFARARLAAWMVPAHVQWTDALPRLGNGKIDLVAVERAVGEIATSRDFLPPKSATEVRLAAIWQEALGGAPVSRDADFFAVGGHSIAAIVVVNRVREEFEVDIPMRTLFRVPVLRDLATEIDDAEPGSWEGISTRERAMVDLDDLLADLEDDTEGAA